MNRDTTELVIALDTLECQITALTSRLRARRAAVDEQLTVAAALADVSDLLESHARDTESGIISPRTDWALHEGTP